MKFPKYLLQGATLLIIPMVGIMVVGLADGMRDSHWAGAENIVQQTHAQTVYETNTQVDPPVELEFTTIGYRVAVTKGGIENKEWILRDDSAMYVDFSAAPASSYGNTVVYGHNTKEVLLNTKKLVVGDVVKLTTEHNTVFLYRYEKFEIVPGSDLGVFDYTGDNRLAIITCSGWLNQNRKIMYFSKIN